MFRFCSRSLTKQVGTATSLKENTERLGQRQYKQQSEGPEVVRAMTEGPVAKDRPMMAAEWDDSRVG